MGMKRMMTFLVLAAALVLGGSSVHGCSSDVSSTPSSSQAQNESGSAVEAPSAIQSPSDKTTSASDGSAAVVDMSDRLPYKGMLAEYIDQTWLGPSDEAGEPLTSGKFKGGVPYYWRARNGTDDLVFTAYENNGEVVGVAKCNLGKNYWGDGTGVLSSGLPDLNASGGAMGKGGSSSSAKPDPDGWDDAEDYADANSSSFKTWDEAYEYWLEEIG